MTKNRVIKICDYLESKTCEWDKDLEEHVSHILKEIEIDLVSELHLISRKCAEAKIKRPEAVAVKMIEAVMKRLYR